MAGFLCNVTLSYERGCQEKNLSVPGYRVFFWTSSPDFLNVRARSASLSSEWSSPENLLLAPREAVSLFPSPVVSFHYHDGANRFLETDKRSLLLS
jgi:hypothetical protein